MFDRTKYDERVKWFTDDRFGMFIHWGLYAIPARGEWVRSFEKISKEDYQIFFDEFNPVDYDPKKWAKAAKDAGMKYAVLTAKHHDGFCLFDSKLTEYKSTNTKCKRDLVREYVDAFRAEGLKVGLYYSLLDWYHDDYPHYGDRQHPMRDNESFKGMKHNFDNYIEYMHGQVKELCTNYGQIDVLWFDFSYESADGTKMSGEKWKSEELVKMIRSYQPNVIIDNRLEVNHVGKGSIYEGKPTDISGDFVSPEQIIPPSGIVDNNGDPIVWESCITMNNHWGYAEKDEFFKNSDMVVKKLVECVSKGGNLLFNVGPDAKGNIPQESLNILDGVGKWMDKNKESIYGCGLSKFAKPEFGRITCKGNKVYYHIMESQVGFFPLSGLKIEDVKMVRLLSTGSELHIATNWITENYPNIVFVSLGENPALPDSTDTVIEVTLKSK